MDKLEDYLSNLPLLDFLLFIGCYLSVPESSSFFIAFSLLSLNHIFLLKFSFTI